MPELYEITCPHCAKVYELPSEKITRHAGSKIQCKRCTGVFLMPALPEASRSAAPEPERALVGAGAAADTASQTPWPFAFTADDEDAEDVQDVEIEEPADDDAESASDSHFADNANGLTGSYEATDDPDHADETIDVEATPTATREPEPATPPAPAPAAAPRHRMSTLTGKADVDAPFVKEEPPAKKPDIERRERPARKPVSREVALPTTEVASELPPATPAIDPALLAAVSADIRSIRRWVRAAGWLFVLGIVAAITLPTLTYFGVIDWAKVVEFWNAGYQG